MHDLLGRWRFELLTAALDFTESVMKVISDAVGLYD